jgi:hypothetical protein
LAWTLVLERAHSVGELGLTQPTYAGVLLLLGLWLFALPSGARHQAGAVRRMCVNAAVFALMGAGWCGLWNSTLAPALGGAWADVTPWLLLGVVLLLDRVAVLRVLRLARIEVFKLSCSRLVRVGLVAVVGLTALAGIAHERLANETSWSAAAGMLGVGFAVAQVFLLVLGAISIAGEASQGTLKMILPHAYRRSDWVLAKAASLLVAALVYAALVLGTALLLARLGGPLAEVTLTSEGFGGEPLVTVHATAEAMRSHLIDTALAETLALATTGLLGLCISSMILGVVGALCTAFLAFAALKLGDLVLALSQDTLRRLFPWPPERLREVTAKLGQGLSEGWDARLPAMSLLLSAATSALLVLVAARALARRDLHL